MPCATKILNGPEDATAGLHESLTDPVQNVKKGAKQAKDRLEIPWGQVSYWMCTAMCNTVERGMVISNGSRTDSRQSRGKSRLSAAPEASSFTGRATRGFSNQMRARRDVCGFSICACANYDVSMRIMSSASSAHSSLTASFLLLPRMTSAAAHLCYGLLLRLWIS